MLGWRVALLGVTCAGLLVTVYRLLGSSRSDQTRPYLPLNETSQLRLPPLPLDRRLVDLDDFQFLTQHDCNGSSPFVLALVHSAPKNSFNREVVRRTWGRSLKVFFLIGETDLSLENEERRYNDIIRGSFKDSYRNLTYKHVMGLKWVSTKCPGARYVLKTDDDVFVNAEALKDWLLGVSPHGAKNLMACHVERNAIVKRSYRSKWRVTPEEYPGRYYPDYCLGWVIVYSPDVMQSLYAESSKSSYFWIDDVLITGILAEKANITHLHLGEDLAISDPDTVSDIALGRRDDPFIFLLTTSNKFDQLDESIYRFRYRHLGTR